MKNEMMETNQTGFLALQDFDLANVMCAEMDGLSAAFERVKIPSGGGVMFEIPGENPEEPDTVKTFSAVILYQHSLNAYYQSEYQGGSNPPDCGSFDGHHVQKAGLRFGRHPAGRHHRHRCFYENC